MEILIGFAIFIIVGGFFTQPHRVAIITTTAKDLIESVPDALLICNADGYVVECNTRATELFGYTKDEFMTLTAEDLMPEHNRRHHKHQRELFNEQPSIRPMGMGRELSILNKKGEIIPVEIALGFSDGNIHNEILTIVILYDITDRLKNLERIQHLAYYDILTNLPNRSAFYHESKHIIQNAASNDMKLAFVLLDIRDLKKINNSLGHYVGDDVLQQTAMILKNHINQSQYADITSLYKIGGDEFIILLTCEKGKSCDTFIDTFISDTVDLFTTPINMDGTLLDININVNVGASVLPNHGMSTSQLLKTADIALIKSKQTGTNNYTYYSNLINSEFEDFSMYENAIRYFIQTKNFDISFQPVWDISKQQHVGAEVLFRCNEKIYPNMNVEFLINVAESTGLIVPLGSAILERACSEIYKHDDILGDLVVSINASTQQVEDNEFTETVKDILHKTRVNPNNVALELTETILMTGGIESIEKLNEMRTHGLRIYIDDFGKGFSSMSYLKNIPADKLKIDMEFLNNVETDQPSVEILRGMIKLGHALEMIVCMEGVETQDQLDILTNLGCDETQGYFTGRPVPLDQLIVECDVTSNIQHQRTPTKSE